MSTNERPTPETDVEEYNCSPNAEYGGQEWAVPSDFARRLERQRDALAEALRRAHALCEEALPKFNWGASALDGKAIALLNDVPLEVARALAALERGEGKEVSDGSR